MKSKSAFKRNLLILVLVIGLLPALQAQDPATVTITGTVTNGSVGGTVPNDLAISLHIINTDTLEEIGQFSTAIGSDASYTFDGVPSLPDAIYLLSTTYLIRDFSVLFQVEANQAQLDIPLQIYELTSDPTALTINGMVMDITGVSGVLEVRFEMLISNNSDRMFATDKTLADGRPIALEIPLPPASVLASDNFGRFIFDEETFTVYDTQTLLPGVEQSISFVFLIPYAQSAVIEYPLSYQLSGQVIVLLNTDSLSLISQQFAAIDEDVIELDARAYGNMLTLAPGEVISYEIRGIIAQNSETPDSATSDEISDDTLPILAGGLALVIILLAGSFWLMRRTANPTVSTDSLIDNLVQQINSLDADHQAGRINHDVYRHKRAELEARIQAILEGNIGS